MAFLWPSTLYALRHRVCATGTGPTAAVLVWPVTMMMLVPAAGQRFGLPDPLHPRIAIATFPLAENTDPRQSSLYPYVLWKTLILGDSLSS
jgi:hypothetical protein